MTEKMTGHRGTVLVFHWQMLNETVEPSLCFCQISPVNKMNKMLTKFLMLFK